MDDLTDLRRRIAAAEARVTAAEKQAAAMRGTIDATRAAAEAARQRRAVQDQAEVAARRAGWIDPRTARNLVGDVPHDRAGRPLVRQAVERLTAKFGSTRAGGGTPTAPADRLGRQPLGGPSLVLIAEQLLKHVP